MRNSDSFSKVSNFGKDDNALQFYKSFLDLISEGKKCLAILIDPDKFRAEAAKSFLEKIPNETTHRFVGGSFVENGVTEATVKALKRFTELPVFLFPGDSSQITDEADALLFLSLLSGPFMELDFDVALEGRWLFSPCGRIYYSSKRIRVEFAELG